MKTKKIIGEILIITVLLGYGTSCTKLDADPDLAKQLQTETVHVSSSGTSIVDLRAMIIAANGSSINVMTAPKLGTLSPLTLGVLSYTTTQTAAVISDNFTLTIYDKNKKALLTNSVALSSDVTDLACGVYPNPDYVYDFVPADYTTRRFDVESNDVFVCGSASDYHLVIYSASQGVYANVSDNKLTVTPRTIYEGKADIIYELVSRADSTKKAYGLLHVETPAVICPFYLIKDFDYKFNYDSLLAAPQPDSVALRVFDNDDFCDPNKADYTFSYSLPFALGHGSVPASVQKPIMYFPGNAPPGQKVFLDSAIYKVCQGSSCKESTIRITFTRP